MARGASVATSRALSSSYVGAIYQFSGGVRDMSEHADKADSAKAKANAKPATS